jgi:regulator of sigma E protease
MNFLWAIVLFGLLIFFHELGHFILAKLVGVKVLKFSLGFGPRILGRKIGETEYILSALPLGGYVKPLGEEPGEELTEEEKPRAFNFQPVWKRVAIVLAGPVFNLVLAYIIFVAFLSLNHPIRIPDLDTLTPKIINVIDDSPAMKAGLEINDLVVSINGKDINAWIELEAMVLMSPGEELTLQVKRDGKIVDLRVTPESQNIRDAEGKEITVGSIGVSRRESIIGEVFAGTPAMKAGLRSNDTVVSIDGVSVRDWNEMSSILSESPGRELTLKVKRGGDLIDVRITPEPKTIKDEDGNEITVGRIGISSKSTFLIIQSDNLLQVPVKAFQAVYEWWVLTLETVIRLITGGVSVKQLGGPIQIVDYAAKAKEEGFLPYFSLVAIISVNLALLNLLPIPVLDGGHILFFAIEAITGRPLNEKVIGVANRVGMSLLLLLIAFVLYNDTMKVIVPWIQKSFPMN